MSNLENIITKLTLLGYSANLTSAYTRYNIKAFIKRDRAVIGLLKEENGEIYFSAYPDTPHHTEEAAADYILLEKVINGQNRND